jgi:smad nuclear-interacting protein 1
MVGDVQVTLPNESGDMTAPKTTVKPYLMDLESTNGTFVNGDRLPPARYVELKEKDVLSFGMSTRTYILLPEDAA